MTVTYRPATPADTPAIYRVFTETLADLSARINQPADSTAGAADAWLRRKPLFDHLAATAAYSWVAEAEGEVIGYARSIQRGPLLELTEFFVLPGRQSAGVGGRVAASRLSRRRARRRQTRHHRDHRHPRPGPLPARGRLPALPDL